MVARACWILLLASIALVVRAQTITPASASLRAGQIKSFSASAPCAWTTRLGSITPNGLYQAPPYIWIPVTDIVSCGSGVAQVSLSLSQVNGIAFNRSIGSVAYLAPLPPVYADTTNENLLLDFDSTVFALKTDPAVPARQMLTSAAPRIVCPPPNSTVPTGLICFTNPDGTQSLQVNTAVLMTRLLDELGSCRVLASSNGTSGYTATLAPQCTALLQMQKGMHFLLTVDSTNLNGGCSMNVDGLGVHDIKQADGATDPAANFFQPGQYYWIVYDGVVWRLV